MKLKTAFVTAALALSASLAAAEPLSFEYSTPLDSGPFSLIYKFNLADGANLFGSVKTTISTADDLSIASLILSNGSTQFKFDTLGDGFDFDTVSHDVTTTTIKGFSTHHYINTYAWDPVFLSAGDWTVTVTGANPGGKQGGALDLLLVDPPANTVPEPTSIALALAALAGVAVASRRRRSS